MLRNIAVLVSGGGTNLQALIDAQAKEGLGGGRIALVVASKPEAYALTRADSAGIPTRVVSRRDYADADAFADALLAVLEEFGIELVVLAGFLYVLPPRRSSPPSAGTGFTGCGCTGPRSSTA